MNLLQRLWVYQAERFPLKRTVPLLGVFSAASLCVSANLNGNPVPDGAAFLTAFVLSIAVFFQLRVCDEWKDAEDDRRYRPHRPIPRGLVTQRTILVLGVATSALAAMSAWLWYPPLLGLLLLVWVWLAAMTVEFGAPAWLRKHPVPYLVSHMAIMPLLDLLVTSVEWLPGGRPPPGLELFLALSFVNGCVIEVGRKLWAPDNEIEGVDSYSRLWGPKNAGVVWLSCVTLSFVLLVAVGFVTGVGWITVLLAGMALSGCVISARSYMKAPTREAQDRMDVTAGYWVFFCYATAGFLPYLAEAIA